MFSPSGREPEQRWLVQQYGQQRQLLDVHGERRDERLEPEPELRQRGREPEQQLQEQRVLGPLPGDWSPGGDFLFR